MNLAASVASVVAGINVHKIERRATYTHYN